MKHSTGGKAGVWEATRGAGGARAGGQAQRAQEPRGVGVRRTGAPTLRAVSASVGGVGAAAVCAQSPVLVWLCGAWVAALCVCAHGSLTTLPNGLSVQVVETRASDVCGVHLALAIGPERVPAEKAGLGALVQQLLLDRMKDRMAASTELGGLRLEGTQGAGLQAETQWDQVEFAASVTSRNLGLLLSFLAASVFHSRWDEDAVLRAKDVIAAQEESEYGLGDASSQVLYLLRRALVGENSPLAQPIFGTDQTRQNITLADARSFYESFYVPNLASLCVVGPLGERETLALVRRAFGELSRREVARVPPIEPRPLRSRVQVGLSPELHVAVVAVGFTMPPVSAAEHVLAEVAYAALSGRGGELQGARGVPMPVTMSVPEHMALAETPIYVLPIPLSRWPYLAALARSPGAAIEETRQAILGAFAKLAQTPLSAEALKRAKLRALNLHVMPMDVPQFAATVINRYHTLGVSLQTYADFARRVQAVTAEELQQFARKYFAEHAVGVLMPGR